MKFFTLFFAILCHLVLAEKPYSFQNSIEDMEKYGIVPEIIDALPKLPLEVTYEDHRVVDFGGELKPSQVQNKPTVKWESDSENYYTLLMTDPDAPSRAEPTFGEVRHWLVGNIRGNAVEEGEQFVEYLGTSPPKDSGLHRYIFFVFKQSGKLEFDEPKVDGSNRGLRYKTSTRKLIEKYGLGQPIAGNFFQAQWEGHV